MTRDKSRTAADSLCTVQGELLCSNDASFLKALPRHQKCKETGQLKEPLFNAKGEKLTEEADCSQLRQIICVLQNSERRVLHHGRALSRVFPILRVQGHILRLSQDFKSAAPFEVLIWCWKQNRRNSNPNQFP